MGTYGISHTDIMDSVWHVVEAVNNYPQFQITYPSSVGEQEKLSLVLRKQVLLDSMSVRGLLMASLFGCRSQMEMRQKG